MSNITITSGIIPHAKKVVIYGPEGIGKTTLASKFPDPVFIDTEGGTRYLNVKRFPSPSSWTQLKLEVQYAKDHPEQLRTLVIDTADWAESLCKQSMLAEKGVSGIEDFGYGKGYTYLQEYFGKLLNLLSDVVEKGINVVITAHAMMRKFEQPDELGAYDRWELKLSKTVAPMVKEWADMILFCNYKTLVVNVDNQGAQKGKNKPQGGKRVMYATHHNCWDAKNRYGLPDEMPLDYEQIRHVLEDGSVKNENPAPEPESTKIITPASVSEIAADQEKKPPVPEEKSPIGMNPPVTPEPKQVTSPPPAPAPQASEDSHTHESEPPRFLSDPGKIPKALQDLMNQDGISEWTIQQAVHAKGYYPDNVLIQDYDPGFIQGWLIAFWPKVCDLCKQIEANQEVPFS